jgi:hypothetical protein
MDYRTIVKNAKKYHYYITTTTRIAFLGSSNKKNEAKKIALIKLKPNIDNLIGKKLVVVKIKSVAKAFEKQKTSSELKIIGGPILFKFERGLIKSTNKISNFIEMGNDEIYLSDKYIKKHKDNIAFDLKKLVRDVMTEKIHQGLLAMTIL